MPRKFTIKKQISDVSYNTGRFTFDPIKQIFTFSAFIRGDDYDPGDGNHPQLRITELPSTIKASLELTPSLLSNTEYRWLSVSWDPRETKPFITQSFALIGGVYDEDGDINGFVPFVGDADIRVPTTILTPQADEIEGDTIEIQFKPTVIAWKQKFKPKVMMALEEDMSDEELAGSVTHFNLKTKPDGWIAVDVAGGDYVKTLGSTPMESATVDWDEADVHWDEIYSFKATGVDIGTHDSETVPVTTDLYFEIDYQAELL